jgi:hypothetical protein
VDRSASIRLGSYQFSERLGEGGSGQVWRAVGPDGPVAVKVLSPAGELDEAARARFRREIAALGQLRHPHLVPLLDSGIDPELGPYLVLPLLPGVTLRDLIAGRAMCPEAAILLALPVIEAAAALHAAGYVHRDLKPENVIASPDGGVTVIDLGLAWRDGMTRHTDTGAAVGSVGYMAPEQIEGRAVDAAADVWALGVMIYEWIAGRRPFARPRPSEEAAAALIATCPKLTAADRRADEPLAALVARCLAPDPASRPTARALATELAAMIDWAQVPPRGGAARPVDGTEAPAAPSQVDALATERAAVIADPIGYQARVAPLRVRRLERLAREALDAGRPFAALALCDRGLAYAPDHAGLSALVTEVEAATAVAAPRPVEGPEVVPVPAAPAVTTGGSRAAVPAVASTGMPARRKRWLIGAAAVIGAAGFAFLIVVLVRQDHPKKEDPWAPTVTTTTTTGASDDNTREGMAVAKGMLNLFDRVITADERKHAAAKEPGGVPVRNGPAPTTATGWLELASSQPAAEALLSVRQALALQPTWQKARDKLCELLVRVDDPEAREACADAVGCASGASCAARVP